MHAQRYSVLFKFSRPDGLATSTGRARCWAAPSGAGSGPDPLSTTLAGPAGGPVAAAAAPDRYCPEAAVAGHPRPELSRPLGYCGWPHRARRRLIHARPSWCTPRAGGALSRSRQVAGKAAFLPRVRNPGGRGWAGGTGGGGYDSRPGNEWSCWLVALVVVVVMVVAVVAMLADERGGGGGGLRPRSEMRIRPAGNAAARRGCSAATSGRTPTCSPPPPPPPPPPPSGAILATAGIETASAQSSPTAAPLRHGGRWPGPPQSNPRRAQTRFTGRRPARRPL